jgi:hypothetical protein
VLNGYLREALENPALDVARVRTLVDTTRLEGVSVDAATLEFAYRSNLERLADQFAHDPTEPQLRQLDAAASALQWLPFDVDLWKIQNVYYGLMERVYPEVCKRKERGDAAAKAWGDAFGSLGKKLGVRVRC